MSKKRLTIYMDQELIKQIKHKSVENNYSVSALVEHAVEEYLKDKDMFINWVKQEQDR